MNVPKGVHIHRPDATSCLGARKPLAVIEVTSQMPPMQTYLISR